MKFFIDTANVDEIKEAADLGVLDGVTTNPSLLSKEIQRTGESSESILQEICRIVQGPVSAEVLSLDWEGMVKEAVRLAKLDDHIVVKIPIVKEGLKAVKKLTGEGIRTNVTLVFSPTQALLAAKAGATYVSPFVGRLDDISHVGMDLVGDIVTILEGIKAKVSPGAKVTYVKGCNVIGDAVHRHVIVAVQKHGLAEPAVDKLRIAGKRAVVTEPGRIQCIAVELPPADKIGGIRRADQKQP